MSFFFTLWNIYFRFSDKLKQEITSSRPYSHTPGWWRNGDLLESDRTGWQPSHGASRELFSLICPRDNVQADGVMQNLRAERALDPLWWCITILTFSVACAANWAEETEHRPQKEGSQGLKYVRCPVMVQQRCYHSWGGGALFCTQLTLTCWLFFGFRLFPKEYTVRWI